MQPYPNAHQKAINAFILDAEKVALAAVWKSGLKDKEAKDKLFTRTFHREMDRLCEAAGIRKHRPDKWA